MSERPLSDLLRRVGRLVLVTETGRTTALVAALLVVAALAAVFFDAVFGLPAGGLLTVDVLAVAAVLGASAWLVRRILGSLADPRRTARRIEQTLGIRDNRLINAIDLAEKPSPTASPELRARAVESGDRLASQIEARSTVPLRPLARAAGWAAGAAGVLGLCWLTMPGVFAAVLPRYFDPHGDHPPYTLVTFDVSVSPETAHYGKPATISAKLGGPEVMSQADVVFLQTDESGAVRPGVRLPMLRGRDGEFLLPIERVEKSRPFYVETPRGRSRRHTVQMLEIPSIDRAEVVYRFPAYTEWPENSHPLDGRGLRALSGTGIEITAAGNMPLKSGRLELFREGEDQPYETTVLQPSATEPETVRGSTTLAASGRFRVTITAVNGSDCAEPREGKVAAAADRPPTVGITHPDPRLVVVEGYTVPVIVQAADDVGVDRLELRATINGWGPSPVELNVDRREPTVVRGVAEFNLPELGAKAGDVITYQATAYDRFPPDGQIAESATHVIQVISEEEYLEYARSEYQMKELLQELEGLDKQLEDLNRERDKLIDELEALEKKLKEGDGLSPEEQKTIDELRKRLRTLNEQMEKLANEAEDRAGQDPVYDLEKPFQELLKELSESLKKQAELAERMEDALERLRKNPEDREALKDLEEALKELNEQQEQDKKAEEEREQLHNEMNRLSKVDELVEQGERMQEIIERQRELADRLGEFRNRDSLTPEEQRRADRLAREQERLKQELEKTADEMEQTAKECEGDAPRTAADAKELARAVREMKIGEDQGKAAGQAREGNGRESHEAAESAAEKLESLAEKAPTGEGAAGEMEGQRDPGLRLTRGGAGKSLRQMAQGRKLPGMRGMPGQKGQGRQPGQKPGDKPGGEGTGTRGSMARQTVIGPHAPLGDQSKPKPGRQGADGKGEVLADRPARNLSEAESLTPAGRTNTRTSAGNLRGVPAPFRDQAERYFRRLAEGK